VLFRSFRLVLYFGESFDRGIQFLFDQNANTGLYITEAPRPLGPDALLPQEPFTTKTALLARPVELPTTGLPRLQESSAPVDSVTQLERIPVVEIAGSSEIPPMKELIVEAPSGVRPAGSSPIMMNEAMNVGLPRTVRTVKRYEDYMGPSSTQSVVSYIPGRTPLPTGKPGIHIYVRKDGTIIEKFITEADLD